MNSHLKFREGLSKQCLTSALLDLLRNLLFRPTCPVLLPGSSRFLQQAALRAQRGSYQVAVGETLTASLSMRRS